MIQSKVTSKYQVTIPKAVREALGIEVGDRIAFTADGRIVRMPPKTKSINDLEGILPKISSVAQTRELVVEDEDLVIHALEIFQETKAGFADILIALKSEQAGCTETLTFDRRAARDAGMTLAE